MSLFKQHRPAFNYASDSYGASTSPFLPASERSSPGPSSPGPSSPGPSSATTYDASEKIGSVPLADPANLHHFPHRIINVDVHVPHRGLYDQRRVPSALEEVMSHARSRSAGLRSRLGGGEGGLGRALILGWIVTTAMFILATAFWRGRLFSALDRLSKDLLALGLKGKIIFGFLILVTTIPPLPLYSTLMVLSGYTFGVWQGFVVSYLASLIGAVLVFVVSRTLLRDVLTKCLSTSSSAMCLLQIIPANPHLLLLIRIAPYPYNLLNVILASAPSLTLRTYTACTALSLCKLVVHTWLGSGIHDLSEAHTPEWRDAHWHAPNGEPGQWRPPHMHHPHGGWTEEDRHREDVKMWSTWAGIGLCVVLFFYLTHLAKRALARAQAEQERDGEGEAFAIERL